MRFRALLIVACTLCAPCAVSAAPVTYYFFHCASGRGVTPVVGSTTYESSRCFNGQGQWVAVTYPPTEDQIAWDSVVYSAGNALLMWVAGIGIGMALNMVKKANRF